jgi:hypothetical protein
VHLWQYFFLRSKTQKLTTSTYNFIAMTKQIMIEQTLKVFNQLPEEKVEEISNFADFILKRYEESELLKGIQKISYDSNSFTFLNEETDLYTLADLKKVYND